MEIVLRAVTHSAAARKEEKVLRRATQGSFQEKQVAPSGVQDACLGESPLKLRPVGEPGAWWW